MTAMPVFTITRLFKVPRDVVFAAWVDQEKMAMWSGPPGAKLTILSGNIAEGSMTHTRSDHPEMGTMHTLALWREIVPVSRIAWEQSFADEQGNKIRPFFFPAWPLTLLTEVDFTEEEGGTRVKLDWTPIEANDEDIAEFIKQMGSMSQGWGGSFDKLEEYLAG